MHKHMKAYRAITRAHTHTRTLTHTHTLLQLMTKKNDHALKHKVRVIWASIRYGVDQTGTRSQVSGPHTRSLVPGLWSSHQVSGPHIRPLVSGPQITSCLHMFPRNPRNRQVTPRLNIEPGATGFTTERERERERERESKRRQ